MAVLRAGVLRQLGTPAEVYEEPADAWVAGFVGEANLWPAEPAGDALVATPLGALRVAGRGGTVLLRPERVALDADGPGGRQGGVPGTVERVDYRGHDALITVRVAGGPVLARRTQAAPPVGASVLVRATGPGRLLPG